MPLINLIAEQRFLTRRAEQRTRFAFYAFAGSAGVVVSSFAFLFILTQTTASDVARLKNEVNKLEPIRKEIEANRTQLNDLWPRLTTLEDAQTTTAKWSRILQHVSHNTPNTMWLTQMRALSNDPTKPIQATFQGITGRLEPVGEFILRLQTSSDLEAVTLRFAQEKLVNDGRGIEFEITADVAGTAETPPAKSKEDKSSA
jgi:Tfp pilus assembly protein PilN